MNQAIDSLDARLLRVLAATPRAGVMELARQLEVARGTAQARLDKLRERGIITGFGPDLDLHRLGYEVVAFITLEIQQGNTEEVIDYLKTIPEVLEIHAITGHGDLLCRVVAKTNADLHPLISRIHAGGGIERSTTQIALTEQLPMRVQQLVDLVINDGNPGKGK